MKIFIKDNRAAAEFLRTQSSEFDLGEDCGASDPGCFRDRLNGYATYWGGRRGPGASTVAFPSALTDAKLGGRPSPYGDFWSVGMGGILFSERLLNFSEHVRTVSRAWGFSMPLEQKSARHKNIP